MRNRAGETLSTWRKLFLGTAGIVALALPLFVGALTAPVWAQSPTAPTPAVPQWQTDAGGKRAFQVASVKENKSGPPPSGAMHTNVGLSAGGDYAPTGGLLTTTNWPLSAYIAFAYKISFGESVLMVRQLPKWATTDRFDIEARV